MEEGSPMEAGSPMEEGSPIEAGSPMGRWTISTTRGSSLSWGSKTAAGRLQHIQLIIWLLVFCCFWLSFFCSRLLDGGCHRYGHYLRLQGEN